MAFASVRARTTALAALVVAITLTAGAFGLLATLEHSLISNRDDLSRARAADLVEQARTGTLPRVLTDIGEDFVGQVVAADGSVLAASSGLIGHGPMSSPAGATSTPTLRTLSGVPDDSETESYRVWALRAPTSSGPVTVFVGASLESVGETVSSLRRELLVGVPLMLVLLAGGTRILVGRALKPVEDIRTEVEGLSDRALNRRVAVPPTRDEVARLAETMNAMLERVEAARTRLQEFVADASHELQSPLAAFRVQLEVALAHPSDVDWPLVVRDLLADSDRMERLVRDLLFLAQDDAVSRPQATRALDLDVVVLDEVARLRPRVPVGFDTTHVSAAPLQGHADDLARLVRNLLENAAAHARSSVEVALSSDGRSVLLVVCDDGPGIPAEHRDRVFERFARVDSGRARDRDSTTGGTGLGLSIARVIAERHHGSIRVAAPRHGVGACLEVRLPTPSLAPSTSASTSPTSPTPSGG